MGGHVAPELSSAMAVLGPSHFAFDVCARA